MTLPLTTTMSRIAAPRIPYTMFDVNPLAAANAVYGVGNEAGHRVQMTCIHYALTTGQCCSRDGHIVTSYSISNGNQCDVIAHTRGKTSDVIAAPRHICSLPLATGRAP